MFKPNQQVGRVSSSFMPSWANEGRNIPTPGLSYYQLFPQSIEAAFREAEVVEKATKKRLSAMKNIYSKMKKGNRRFKGGSTGDVTDGGDDDDDSTIGFDTDDDILGDAFDAAVEQIEQTQAPQGREATSSSEPRRGKVFPGFKRPPPPSGPGKGAIRAEKRLRVYNEVSEQDLKDYDEMFRKGQKLVRDRDRLIEQRNNPRPGGKQPGDRVIQHLQDQIDDLSEDYPKERHKDLVKFYKFYPRYKNAEELEEMLGNNEESDLNKAKYLYLHWYYHKEARDEKDNDLKDQLGEPLDGAVVDVASKLLKSRNLNLVNPNKQDIWRTIEGIRSDGGVGKRKRKDVFDIKQWHRKT